jgi:hypothetical protein
MAGKYFFKNKEENIYYSPCTETWKALKLEQIIRGTWEWM